MNKIILIVVLLATTLSAQVKIYQKGMTEDLEYLKIGMLKKEKRMNTKNQPYISDEEYVGIGTTDPMCFFWLRTEEQNNYGVLLKLRTSGGVDYDSPKISFTDGDNDNSTWAIGMKDNNDGGFGIFKNWGTNAQSSHDDAALYVSEDQNVGIGTTSPGDYKLAVDGTIKTRKVIVTQKNWADYVFKKDYPLLPLEDVEKHIEEKGHLPNVPSAEEVVDEGLSLGDMQTKIMEKVEELTLYVIEQDKEIKRLKKELVEYKRGE